MTSFVKSSVPALAPIVLSAALMGCREEPTTPPVGDSGLVTGPAIVRSLPEAAQGGAGSRVYLSNIKLVALPLVAGEVGAASHYMVMDAQGARMPCVLRAAQDSFLWSLVPTGAERVYSDFGATLERIDGSNVLAIFKLAN